MLTNYLKIAWRNLITQRSYTLLTTIGLSVGMAGALLIFLFLKHHLSTDRYHTNFDRIFRIDTDLYLANGSIEYNPEAPLPMAQTLRSQYPQVEQAAFLMMNRELTVGIKQAGQATITRFLEHAGTGLTDPAWFDIMSYTWLAGNPQTALREPNSVVLTHSRAKKYFGDADPMGRTITLNNKLDATVTGLVADPPAPTDTNLGLFISLATLKQFDPTYDATNWWYLNSTNRVYVTLKNPAAAAALDQSLTALAKKQYGADAKFFRFHTQPMREFHFDVARGGGAIRQSLLWSLGIIGILLIGAACINFVNLSTVQALRRSKEVGIRKTLGSSHQQLVFQFLLETTLITLLATGLAAVLVLTTLPLFNNWVQLNLVFRLDWSLAGFIGLLLGSVVLLAGGYPSLVLAGFSPSAALRGTLAATSTGGFTVRRVLVVAQFVACQVLIVGAVIVASQMRYIQQADLGYRKDNVIVVRLPNKQKSTREALRQQLSQYADIQSVSFSHRPPASSQLFGGSFKFNGSPDWALFPIRDRLADAEFLDTYGIKLVAGRNIMTSDTIREYLINETMLHQLGFRDPQQVLGKKMQYHLSGVPMPIVGVVKDFHEKSLHEAIGPCFIASYADWYARASIRLSGNNPTQSLQRIRETWQQLYPGEVFEYEYFGDQIATFYETETLAARLINTFTGIAILIGCLGLYGLISHVVLQRTKEIGIRKVLGASVAGIVTLLSKDFIRLVVIAIIVATPIAWYAMSKWLNDFVYRIAIEWWIFALAGVLAVSIALLTISFQSIRAAMMDPVQSLRSE
ncbi:ABC transporter permease [Spirosoma utsteinense]|uniref:ABC transport system permease protein n=1 Tax=Spirosoma utsteinense TaxID=2585773 RepID=A0ABR6W5F3_9BACT|nr:ABC transporter permease [Spirosoma utsteinense]MBC3788567.1 putative ABC transport system permease protein [Spirosoma utsteinense]MBC3791826.1 putative ABC transport system permease protein [Spirosoma utsteinense]